MCMCMCMHMCMHMHMLLLCTCMCSARLPQLLKGGREEGGERQCARRLDDLGGARTRVESRHGRGFAEFAEGSPSFGTCLSSSNAMRMAARI